MAKLPETVTKLQTQLQVEQHYEQQNNTPPRPHLGASIIGTECERQLWYTFHHCLPEQFEGRMLRLFETGQREEERIKANLKAIDVTVHDQDEDGKQFGFSSHGGHFRGSVDGVLENVPDAPKTPHLLEAKTSNDKRWKTLKKGVEEAMPGHFAQMQVYMGKLELSRALYWCTNKNTDELYLERVRFNKAAFERLDAKATRIIDATEPLEKLSDDPNYYQCRWCPVAALCHGTTPARANCRTCVHSTPVDGGWHCKHFDTVLESTQTHHEDCHEHLYIPALVPFAQPVDAGEGWVRYKTAGGVEFLNVAGEAFPASDLPHYASNELQNISNPEVIGDPAVESAREILGGKVEGTK